MIFKNVTPEDSALLRGYYENCNYGLCEYSVGTKLMWADELHPAFAQEAGCLIVKNVHQGQVVFDGPPEAVTDGVLREIYGGEAAHEAD